MDDLFFIIFFIAAGLAATGLAVEFLNYPKETGYPRLAYWSAFSVLIVAAVVAQVHMDANPEKYADYVRVRLVNGEIVEGVMRLDNTWFGGSAYVRALDGEREIFSDKIVLIERDAQLSRH
jgi:hypothetical protein